MKRSQTVHVGLVARTPTLMSLLARARKPYPLRVASIGSVSQERKEEKKKKKKKRKGGKKRREKKENELK
jgi:hypothetical protein